MFTLSVYLNLLFDDEPFEDRVDRAAEAGFDGFEMYGWDRDLEPIAEKRDEHDLDWVYMSGGRPDLTDPDAADEAVENIENSIEIAERMDCLNLNVKSGSTQDDLDRDAQRENAVQVLSEAAPAAEDAGVTLVLEPLNTYEAPDHFTTTAAGGAEIVEAVDSPNVKLLFDFYHEQIMAGDVIRSFREHLDQIGHVHIADNPGRNEPGTGELNYGNIFEAIDETGYDGYVGCEFEPSGDPLPILEDVRALRD